MNVNRLIIVPDWPKERWEQWRAETLEKQLKMLGSCMDQLEAEIEVPPGGSQTAGPGLDLESLHPKIARRCSVLFDSGQYDDAILAALIMVEEEIRARICAEPSDVGVNLVSKAMNPKSPRLVFSDVASEQEAAHALYRGAIGFLKNPRSHRFVDTADPVHAFEALAFASLLMRLLDGAKHPS